MVKYVKLSDKTGLLLNKAKGKILLEDKEVKKLTDDGVIYFALKKFVGGGLN